METQALSDRHKEAVRSWVPKVRRVLEEDLTAQLERLGVRPDGKHVPIETMRSLGRGQRRTHARRGLAAPRRAG